VLTGTDSGSSFSSSPPVLSSVALDDDGLAVEADGARAAAEAAASAAERSVQPNTSLALQYTLIQSIKLTPDGSILGPTMWRKPKGKYVIKHTKL